MIRHLIYLAPREVSGAFDFFRRRAGECQMTRIFFPLPAVKTSFALPVGGGFLNAYGEPARGKDRSDALLPIIQGLENAIIGRVGEEAQEAGTPVSCRAGCGACCRQLVPVNFFEAEAHTDWIEGLPEERSGDLKEVPPDAFRSCGMQA